MAVTLHVILLLVRALLSNHVAALLGPKACCFDIASARPPDLQLAAPASYSDQRPPLRNHEHQTATSNAHLHQAKALRTLHEPFLIPTKFCINVSAYRCLVYSPSRNHRVHITKVEWKEIVHEGEGDEGQRSGVDDGVS